MSFGKGDLDWVVAYIKNQREHHGRGSAIERLERIDQDENAPTPTTPTATPTTASQTA